MTSDTMAHISSDTTAPSSTPSRGEALFSDATTRPSTPPSSPPGFPWERLQQKQDAISEAATTLQSPPRKNAFAVLGKRKPLQDVSDNVRPGKSVKVAKVKDGAPKEMVQMQMSLGQEMQKRCAQCGMEYTASSTEDRKLHDKFHKQNLEGYDVGKDFVTNTVHSESHPRQWNGVKHGDAIILLDCSDPWQRKKKGQAVLEIVQKELGAVEIPEKQIWDTKGQNMEHSKFKAYLYIRGTKCVGLLLSERITEAFEVVKPKDADLKPAKPSTGKTSASAALLARREAEKQVLVEADKHPIELSTSKTPTVLGISRIWTSPTHRGQGIAKRLLDNAHAHDQYCYRLALRKRLTEMTNKHEDGPERESKVNQLKRVFQPRINSKKTQVAFSQPTESGAKLARRWTGKPYGWLVYVD